MPTKRKPITCWEFDCAERPYLGGYCQQHHEERERAERLRRDALDALSRATVDETPFTQPEYREEVLRVSKWWDRACSVTRSAGFKDAVLGDEAQYAIGWCIQLAEQLVLAERAARSGSKVNELQLDAVRGWVWERFTHLERGLRSNGTELGVAS